MTETENPHEFCKGSYGITCLSCGKPHPDLWQAFQDMQFERDRYKEALQKLLPALDGFFTEIAHLIDPKSLEAWKDVSGAAKKALGGE